MERQMGLEAGVRASQLFSSTFPDPEAEFTTWQEPDKAQRAREGTRQVSPGQVTYKHDGRVDTGAGTAMPQSRKSLLHTSDKDGPIKMHQRTLTDGPPGSPALSWKLQGTRTSRWIHWDVTVQCNWGDDV